MERTFTRRVLLGVTGLLACGQAAVTLAQTPGPYGRPVPPAAGAPLGQPLGVPMTYDPALRRVQDQPPTPAPALPATTSSGATDPPDLTVPAADRPIGGGEATTETAATEAAAAAEGPPGPTKLQDLLGFEESPVKFYGWIQNSFTGNANGNGTTRTNFGVNPNYKANQWMGNQFYLVIENPLEQEDKINFGFRVDNLFGNDWQFNYMQGLFNNAFKTGQFAGYDLAQLYAEVHLPILTEGGLDIKGGRFYTLAGYEQVPAIAKPLLSTPYMFTYGQPFTHFGVMTTLHLTDKINLYNGAINGWDRWVNENYQWGYMGGFSWTGNEDKTSLAFTTVWGPNQYPRFLPGNQQFYTTGYVNVPSLAGQENPGYGRNDRLLFTTVLTHKWTDKLTQVVETDQGMERSIPGLASGGQNGAAKSAQWQSFGNWFLYNFNDKWTGVWRSEVFWDQQGSRTGTLKGDRYYEMTVGAIYKPCPNIWLRPEVRYDWAQYGTPFTDGTRGDQFTGGFDIILLY